MALVNLTVAYTGILVLLYVFQRRIVFQPADDDIFADDLTPYRPLPYTTSDGMSLKGLWCPASDPAKPLLLYFHGNGGNITHRFFKAQYFIDRGYGVAFVAYHGYNGAAGTPTEQNLYGDGRAALQAIMAQSVGTNDIVLYGESLGTGVATQIASENPQIQALILEAPYTSVVDVAAARYWFFPVRALIKDRFDSVAKIGALRMPILIVHGEKDTIVPFRFGQKLFTHVTTAQKRFVALADAGHQDIFNFSADGVVDDFIKNIH